MSIRVPVSRSGLLHLCKLLDSFSARRVTFDSHVETYLSSVAAEEVRGFIRQVSVSVHRRLPLLHAFADALLAFSPSTTLRDDRTLYSLLAWALLGFARDVVSLSPSEGRTSEAVLVETTRDFVFSVSSEKWPAMVTCLEFALFHLHDWVVMEWAKILDIRFIEEKIIGTLTSCHSPLSDLLHELKHKALILGSDAADSDSSNSKKPPFTTVPVPFNLSQSPALPAAQPVDEVLYPFKPEIPKRKVFSSKLPEKRVVPPTVGAMPNLQSLQRPSRTRLSAAALQSESTAEQAQGGRKKPPVFPAQPLVHTVTSVLRLHAQITRQQETEWREIERYLTELRDSAEFDEWRAKMDAADRERDERRVEDRKKEAELARLDAVEAQKRKFAQRRREVQEELQRKERERQKLEDERNRELEERQSQVQEVRLEEREKPAEAVESVKRRNKEEAETLKRQKEEEERRLKLEREKELAVKKDLIARIRALEKISIVRPTPYDPSEPPRHGLLEEMSIGELRERLEIVKLENEREVERRRKLIKQERANKWDDIKNKWTEIAQVRDQRRRARDERRAKSVSLESNV